MPSNDLKPINPNTDSYANLGITRKPDGSMTRKPAPIPTTPASTDNLHPVLSKDIPINHEKNTWARVYLPRKQHDAVPTTKLPLIVYFHGGGFVLMSASTSFFHKFCCELANEIPAVVVSVEYRLAPEHRLPAAYDDGMEALRWLKTTGDEWLAKYADFSKCFLMGVSAGGNLAYNLGLRAVSYVDDLMPLEIRGLILIQPFFGGVQRTRSEIRLENDNIVPLYMTDAMWELALPIGVGRDHEFCNPMVGIKLGLFQKIKDQGWKILVFWCDGDPLVDREIEFVKMLKGKGVDVIGEFSEGGCLGFEVIDEPRLSRAKIIYGDIKNLIFSL